jgi:hypothetical protein
MSHRLHPLKSHILLCWACFEKLRAFTNTLSLAKQRPPCDLKLLSGFAAMFMNNPGYDLSRHDVPQPGPSLAAFLTGNSQRQCTKISDEDDQLPRTGDGGVDEATLQKDVVLGADGNDDA